MTQIWWASIELEGEGKKKKKGEGKTRVAGGARSVVSEVAKTAF